MMPKALLRDPRSSARLEDLTNGSFQPVIDDARALERADQVRRIVLCTGKIAIDLLAHESRAHNEDIAIVRVEMLYPFPGEELKKVLANYPRAREVIWVQEEPRNMGAWSYMFPRLTEILNPAMTIDVIARPDRSTPDVGFWDVYVVEQERIITEASSLPLKQPGGKNVR
jgi:2-oxoglutarate dehydrogenase E1 component